MTKDDAPLVFLSHAGEDADATKELAGQLRRGGLRVWLDVEELKPGDRWISAIEEALDRADVFAVYLGRSGLRNWVDQEVRVALDRSTRNQAFRIIPLLGPGFDPQLLPLFLKQYQYVDLRNGATPTELHRLIGTVLDQPTKRMSLLQPGERPYRGLQVFDVSHATLFFGRNNEVDQLLARLRSDRFLAVVGASGSGKSSLVRAGLIPALHRGRFYDNNAWVHSWRVAVCRPGDDPFRELANALPDLDSHATGDARIRAITAAAETLRSGTDGLGRTIAGLVPAGEYTLLVIDQFEELFTLTEDTSVRRRFVDSLFSAATTKGDRPIHIVVTLRADFYGRCWEHPTLPTRIVKNQYAVERPAPDGLRDIIEKPLALAGATFEPGLVERILRDVGEEPGNLPLLEFALDQLWHRAEMQARAAELALTHRSYDEIGGVSGAVATQAEVVITSLMKVHQVKEDEIRAIFTRLVHVSSTEEGGEATRRRLPLNDLTDDARRLIHALADARLLVTAREQPVRVIAPGSPTPTYTAPAPSDTEVVEVAHEALIRNWDRLKQWVREDQEFLLWRQRLQLAVEEWERSNKDRGVLLRGAPLSEAHRWLKKRTPELSITEQSFIEESAISEEQEKTIRERLRRRVMIVSTASAAVFLLAALLSGQQLYKSQNELQLIQKKLGRLEILDDGPGNLAWKIYPRPNDQEDETIDQWNILTELKNEIASGKAGNRPIEIKEGIYWLALFRDDGGRPQVIPIKTSGYNEYQSPLKISTSLFLTYDQLLKGMIKVGGDPNFKLNSGEVYHTKKDFWFNLKPFYVDHDIVSLEEFVAFNEQTSWNRVKKDEFYINWYDAHAYCMWKRKRLMTAVEAVQLTRATPDILIYIRDREEETVKLIKNRNIR
jgi:hypothetical protein